MYSISPVSRAVGGLGELPQTSAVSALVEAAVGEFDGVLEQPVLDSKW